MTNQYRRTRHKLRFLFSAAALSTLNVGCGDAEELLDDEENIAEAAQGLTTVTLRAGLPGVITQDTFISEGFPNGLSWAATQPYAYVGTKATGSRMVSLMQWDLSAVPQGSTISSATLKLTTTSAFNLAGEVHRVTRAWIDTTASWNSMSTGYDAAIIAQYSEVSTVYTPVSETKDITSLVQDWVSGAQANYGLALAGVSIPGKEGYYYAGEVPTVAHRPELTIAYDPPFCFGQPDGTACNDDNGCTQTDTCQGGQCVGSNPVVCPSSTACTANSCNTATGMCDAIPAANGTACDDGNLCTQTSSCINGTCVGANPVVCPAADACSLGGVCQAATGTCVPGATVASDILTGLKHRWNFDEPSGPVVDAVGGIYGTLTPNLQRTPSFDGTQALTGFAGGGTSTSATLPLGATLGADNYSISAWMWHPLGALAATGPSFQAGLSAKAATAFVASNGKMIWSVRTAAGGTSVMQSNGTLNDGAWHHHLLVGNANGVTAYVDGAVSSKINATNLLKPDAGVYLNGYPGFPVKFEDVRYYTRALTACEAFKLSKEPTTITANVPNLDCGPSPVSLWKGDDTLFDSIGNNNGTSGTLNGSTPVTYTNGKYSRAFDLKGTSYVHVPNSPSLNITGNISMSAWAYINTTGGRIIDKTTVFKDDGYLFDTYQGKLRMIVGKNVIFSSGLLPTGKWIHVAGTWNGSTGRLYLDGALFHTYTPPSPKAIPINTHDIRIGADSTGKNRFNGILDDVALYNVTLSAAQVQTLAQTAPVAPAAGWWKGESNMGDSSGNNNNGVSGTGAGITAVTYGTGKIAGAFSLPGTSFVNVPNSPSLQMNGPITMSAWIRITTAGGRIIDKNTVNQGTGYMLDTHQGKLRMLIGAQIFTSPANLPVGTWTHVAGTWDGTTGKLYVDGTEVLTSSPANPMPPPGNTLPLRIGADSSGGSRFNGLIDDVAVHNIALTPAQIQSIAALTMPAHVPGNACTPSVPGLLASFDASKLKGNGTMVTDGSAVSQWNDLATMKHAVQSTPARQPKFKWVGIKGRASVQFDGVDDVLSLPLDINYTKYPDLTVVAVFQNAAGNPQTYAGVWGHDDGGWDRFFISGGSGPIPKGVSNGSNTVAIPGITVENSPLIAITTMRHGVTNGSTVHLNGMQALTFTESHPNTGSTSMSIGNLEGPPGTGVLSFDGLVSVIEVYDHALTTAERDAVYTKLAALYL